MSREELIELVMTELVSGLVSEEQSGYEEGLEDAYGGGDFGGTSENKAVPR